MQPEWQTLYENHLSKYKKVKEISTYLSHKSGNKQLSTTEAFGFFYQTRGITKNYIHVSWSTIYHHESHLKVSQQSRTAKGTKKSYKYFEYFQQKI